MIVPIESKWTAVEPTGGYASFLVMGQWSEAIALRDHSQKTLLHLLMAQAYAQGVKDARAEIRKAVDEVLK